MNPPDFPEPARPMYTSQTPAQAIRAIRFAQQKREWRRERNLGRLFRGSMHDFRKVWVFKYSLDSGRANDLEVSE